ncbi:MAG: DUF4105 domain-containing protein [Bacteroidales bacterium]|nr:DUF4105 domain-containing protein [Bacteroidales bacterium]
MKRLLIAAFLTLTYFLPARAQEFSDSLRISLLTCSPGPDAYERFGHTGLRIQDQRNPQFDVTFHYGVFSFNTPHFVYRFVKGETDYQLGAVYTQSFIEEYRQRGLGMTEQWLRLDSAQAQDMLQRLLINYRPENRTYRYSYFFDNCATRPYHLINASAGNTLRYDTAWVKDITLRQMVQEKTHRNNWLDFGIALAVAARSDQRAWFEEQMFLPDYLSLAIGNAKIEKSTASNRWHVPFVTESDTLLTMRPDIEAKIAAPDRIAPNTVFGIVLLVALVISAWEWHKKKDAEQKRRPVKVPVVANIFDTALLLAAGLAGCIVWFLNFFSLHPAVDSNLNCFWLLPTHVIMAVLIWFNSLKKWNSIYFGITFALIIAYVILDWIIGQYCPPAFLLLLATLLLRSYMRFDSSLRSRF